MPMKKRSKGLIAGSAMLMALMLATLNTHEGRRLTAYQDVVGVWTICEGWTEGVTRGDVKTPAQCDEIARVGVARYEAGLDRCLTADLPGAAKVQVLSWAWNVGIGAACKSTLVRLANAGHFEDACRQLARWNRAGGHVVQGLVTRRAAEMAACLEGLRDVAVAQPTASRAGWSWWIWIIAGLVAAAGAAWLFYRLRKPKAAT